MNLGEIIGGFVASIFWIIVSVYMTSPSEGVLPKAGTIGFFFITMVVGFAVSVYYTKKLFDNSEGEENVDAKKALLVIMDIALGYMMIGNFISLITVLFIKRAIKKIRYIFKFIRI